MIEDKILLMKKLLMSVAVSVLLFACGGRVDNRDKQIFRYNEVSGISTLDPAFAKDQALIWACSQLYNGLVRLDENLEVEPCLAKSWTISPDGRTYTFLLRDDVCFHKDEVFGNEDSTRRVTAHDFVYSFRRILDPKVASPGLWIFNDVDYNADNLDDAAHQPFKALNDSVFVVRLKQPFPPFLSLLAMPYCSVVPREVVEHYGEDFRKHPCGTGPFKLQLWKEGVKLVMRSNPGYFEQDSLGNPLPYLDAVAVTFIVDKQTVFLEFVKGNLDFMNSLDASYKDEILTRTGQLKKKYQDKIDMVGQPFLNTEYLGFLMDGDASNPLRDKRIRQAVNYGFDRKKMMKYLRNGVGEGGVCGFVPPSLAGGGCEGYDYNPERALELLAEAGYPNGEGLPVLQMATTSSYLDLCRYIQQQLDLVGIKVKIDVNPPAALREQVAQGKSQWFRGSWIADYPDAENYLSLFYSPNKAPAGPNYTHYRNEKFDRLYERAKKETDPKRRAVLYRDMDQILMDDAPVVVLYYDQILHFTHKKVKGLRSNAMNALDLRYVTIGR